jgi:hypothetical protein
MEADDDAAPANPFRDEQRNVHEPAPQYEDPHAGRDPRARQQLFG